MLKTNKLCGFNVGGKFTWLPGLGLPGAKLPHWKSVLKNNTVTIYPKNGELDAPLKIIKGLNGISYRIENGKITKQIQNGDTFTLERTSEELIEKAKKAMKDFPTNLKNIIKIKKFRWVNNVEYMYSNRVIK